MIKVGKHIGLIVVFTALACGLSDLSPPDLAEELPAAEETASQEAGWFSVYFTDPEGTASRTLRGGPDKYLADAIRQARISVDVAVLRLNLWSLRDALMDAHRRGVAVRLVTESEYLEEREVQELIDAGIPVLGDRREALMHNKFVVLDRQEVWTGSMNFTVSDAYRNDNNLVRIRSPLLAENYTTEFEEMFVSDRFGPGSPANTPHPRFMEHTTWIENYFSPDDGVAARLVELLGGAQESIYLLAFSFTADDLAAAMIDRARHGVQVVGVMDRSQARSNTGAEFDRLVAAGFDIRLDGNRNSMHHKVLIIDRQIVATGSYNFSRSAETFNDENILILYNTEITELYLAEFERIFSAGSN